MGNFLTPQIAAFAAFGFVLSAVLTATARPLARQLGFLDNPDANRKKHKEPTPLLGGAAIYIAFLLTSLAAWKIAPELFSPGRDGGDLRLLYLSAGLFFLTGLVDDRLTLRPRTKLLLQILSTLPYVCSGRSIDSLQLMGVGVHLGWFGAAFTIFWLVACSNVVNLTDGLDGLAGTTGFIISVAVMGISAMAGLTGVATASVLYAACLAGFLVHNWPPAKIFLGDSGSLQIGFVVGALAIESSSKKATGFALAIPLVLISIPVFDTSMAIVRRKLTGRSIGDADRGHIHHCLQDRGLSRLQVLLALSSLSLAMAGVTYLAVWSQNDFVAMGLCIVLLSFLIAGRVFGYQETRLVFRHLQAFNQMVTDTVGVLRTRLLLARYQPDLPNAKVDQWDEVTRSVRKMGGLQLELVHWNERTGETIARLSWQRAGATVDPAAPLWQFTYSSPKLEGVRATVLAAGRMRDELRGQRLIDLFRVFESLCENWSSDSVRERAKVVEAARNDDATVAMPLRLPRLLPTATTPEEIDGDRRAA